jgi:hypothetical protein
MNQVSVRSYSNLLGQFSRLILTIVSGASSRGHFNIVLILEWWIVDTKFCSYSNRK